MDHVTVWQWWSIEGVFYAVSNLYHPTMHHFLHWAILLAWLSVGTQELLHGNWYAVCRADYACAAASICA